MEGAPMFHQLVLPLEIVAAKATTIGLAQIRHPIPLMPSALQCGAGHVSLTRMEALPQYIGRHQRLPCVDLGDGELPSGYFASTVNSVAVARNPQDA